MLHSLISDPKCQFRWGGILLLLCWRYALNGCRRGLCDCHWILIFFTLSLGPKCLLLINGRKMPCVQGVPWYSSGNLQVWFNELILTMHSHPLFTTSLLPSSTSSSQLFHDFVILSRNITLNWSPKFVPLHGHYSTLPCLMSAPFGRNIFAPLSKLV